MSTAVGVTITLGHWHWAWWLFAAAALSDSVNGALARRLNATSELGHRLDRWGDGVLLVAPFVSLTIAGVIPWILAAKYCMGAALGVVLILYRRRRSGGGSGTVTPLQFVLGAIGLTILLLMLAGLLASKAYGWHWWFLAVGAATAAVLAVAKRDILRV